MQKQDSLLADLYSVCCQATFPGMTSLSKWGSRLTVTAGVAKHEHRRASLHGLVWTNSGSVITLGVVLYCINKRMLQFHND
jgi:hypothetical protein